MDLETSKGKALLTFENGDTLTVPSRGIRVFPRRAILRIGMLLRDSAVAKEVRTQLLNIEEKTSNEIKTEDINEEQRLITCAKHTGSRQVICSNRLRLKRLWKLIINKFRFRQFDYSINFS